GSIESVAESELRNCAHSQVVLLIALWCITAKPSFTPSNRMNIAHSAAVPRSLSDHVSQLGSSPSRRCRRLRGTSGNESRNSASRSLFVPRHPAPKYTLAALRAVPPATGSNRLAALNDRSTSGVLCDLQAANAQPTAAIIDCCLGFLPSSLPIREST